MISPELFLEELRKCRVSFFAGVPDSLLKSFCAFIGENITPDNHFIAANEGAAIALGIGHHLGSGEVPLIYMQNSGLGNCVNPLISLASPDVYGIPMLLLIGWRGEPGIKDEPQHLHQGRITTTMLDAMGIPYVILSDNWEVARQQTERAMATSKSRGCPFAIVVRKELFEPYDFKCNSPEAVADLHLTREDAIIQLASLIEDNAIIVATTGMASRELYEYRAENKLGHERDFLTVGGMGHASQIALGLAMSERNRKIYCFDGDGAVIMHMGSLAISGMSGRDNFVHVVLNNGQHGSVGGQPTLGFDLRFCDIARACGYVSAHLARENDEIREALSALNLSRGPSFLEIRTLPGNRKDIGRPSSSPHENKTNLMEHMGVGT